MFLKILIFTLFVSFVYTDILLAVSRDVCIVSIDTSTSLLRNITCVDPPSSYWIDAFVVTPKNLFLQISIPNNNYNLQTYSWSINSNNIVLTPQNTINVGCLRLNGLVYSPGDNSIYGLGNPSCDSSYNASLFVYSMESGLWKVYPPVDSSPWGFCSMTDLQSVVDKNFYYYFSCVYIVLFDKSGTMQKQMKYSGPTTAGFPAESAVKIQNSVIGMSTFYSDPPRVVTDASIVDLTTGALSQMNVTNYVPTYYVPYGSAVDGMGRKWFLMVKNINILPNYLLVVDVSNLEKPSLISNVTVNTNAAHVQYLSP